MRSNVITCQQDKGESIKMPNNNVRILTCWQLILLQRWMSKFNKLVSYKIRELCSSVNAISEKYTRLVYNRIEMSFEWISVLNVYFDQLLIILNVIYITLRWIKQQLSNKWYSFKCIKSNMTCYITDTLPRLVWGVSRCRRKWLQFNCYWRPFPRLVHSTIHYVIVSAPTQSSAPRLVWGDVRGRHACCPSQLPLTRTIFTARRRGHGHGHGHGHTQY